MPFILACYTYIELVFHGVDDKINGLICKIVELRRVEADNSGLRLRVSAGGVEGVQVHLLRTIHDVDHV